MFAEVAVPVYVRQTFTYHLPGELGARARVGCRVLVPFGKKLLTAFIVALHEHLNDEVSETEIKDIEELVDESPIIARDILDLTRWMSDYYYAPWGECLRTALPAAATIATEQMLTITEAGRSALSHISAGFTWSSSKFQALEIVAGAGTISSAELERQLTRPRAMALIKQLERSGLINTSHRVGESRMKPRLQNAVRLVSAPPPEEENGREEGFQSANGSVKHPAKARAAHPVKPLNEQQKRVIEILGSAEDALGLSELIEAADVSASVVRTLEKRGLCEVFAREVRRDPLAHIEQGQMDLRMLNEEQQRALDSIVEKMDERRYATFLLHGVTGSGKTEIYIRAMREATRRGLSALMLVPEIALTPMFSRRLRAHFGDAVAILHSSLSDGERTDEWRRIKEGAARLVIGTRSAVFAPLENLGVIIVDEEHETSYKQDDTPRYHGRDTAIMRAVGAGAIVILGSATPSLESFHNAISGKYTYLRMEERYGNRSLAAVETIDMREVFKRHGKQQTFSDELKAAIAETHERGQQSIILLNRRGFSSFALCRSCGDAIRCPNCDVTLTYHRYNSSLQCHYCNYIRPVPRACPACDGQYIHYVGEGTEQLEAKLREMFPAMTIARVDRDTTRRRGSLEHLLMEFAAGTIDLLVGTQMLAKGHDFHNVTLVGVISVDAGLSLPDFRAAERTFQLLTQVAGRAGRGELRGRVVIQTYHPEHYSLVCAKAQDYDEFYRREISFRRSMHYPPFSALINICIHDKEFDRAAGASDYLARELRNAAKDSSLRILGPAPAPIARIKNEHRFQILIKARSRKRAREALDFAMDRAIEAGHNPRSITIEVDPVSLM
ncbi:MAG TPA: primosomal protein N' [Blastocatellia bacterium]|jgi:primosomal protein N' (replication factor Y)|nr:primosomal protein N' [Blastocatellia bacterium]